MPDYTSTSHPLPPYRGILAVDTERFSRNPSVYKPGLSITVHEILQTALARCGHSAIWEQRRFPEGTGDGYLFGVQPDMLPFLLSPFLDALNTTLAEADGSLRAIDRALRLRLRVSVHVGPVPDSGAPGDRAGTPTDTTCRLLDSTPVKQALRQSDPDVTLMAAIVSQRVFEDVIRAGYTPGLRSAQLEQVTADVSGKDFTEPAWLYIPRPSRLPGNLSAPGDSVGTPAELPQRPSPSAGSRAYTQFGSSNQQINADQVRDISFGGKTS